jgi:multidrug efflux pump subunit AcrA (membrane-fusion protein)
MKRFLTPLAAFAIGSAIAAEVTIEPSEFTIRHTFTAHALPAQSEAITINPQSWTTFEITRIADHGTAVKKGEVLIAFDSEPLDQRIEDFERAIAQREHSIARTRLELTNLKETSKERLEASRRAAAEAADDYEHYTTVRHAMDLESSEQSIKSAEQRLQSASEELRQLRRMYEADDLVEETEEIILTRQKSAVEAAELNLRHERISQARRLESTLPRHITKLLETKDETARKLATDEQEIPRAIAMKEAELAGLEVTQSRETETLAKLKADRVFMEITAPVDGVFYYGPIEDGAWTPGELPKSLVVGGRPPVKRPLATIIPANASMRLHAQLDEATARSLAGTKAGGIATLAGREDLAIPVALESLAGMPNPAKRHHAVLSAEWADGAQPAPGAAVEVNVIAYSHDEAISVPKSALTLGGEGWSVEVKLADGKTERRTVSRGRVNGDKVEILSGLESGQVILTP